MSFFHLRTRSEYSILTSAIRLSDLEKYIKDNNVKSMCLMDDMSLSAGLRWSMHLADIKTVKPLIGMNVFIGKKKYNFDDLFPQLGLIAKSEKGYLNILKMLRCAYFEHEENSFNQIWITLDELAKYSDDVILLTGGYRGVIGYEFLNYGDKDAVETLDYLHGVFNDRLYIELTRHGRAKEKKLEDFLVDYAYKKNVPLVATNDVCFLKKDDFKAFDVLACIRDKVFLSDPDRKRLNKEYYLKSEKEMEELFSDIPEAIENTEQIVKRCNFSISKQKPTLPHFCDSIEKENEMVRKMAYDGMEERFKQINWDKSGYKKEDYLSRLEYEIGVIEKMGFSGYFLIVADFVRWSKNNNVAVGAGRGSGAGSLVAWCLKITEVDPIEYGLFFERFLNPERVSMPDFDIDFCQENRKKTINYVINKYGKENVSRIITYGKMKAKMVIKDVGRAMQMSFNETNEIAKLIPFNPLEPITIEKALEIIPKLREAKENDKKISKMMDIAIGLEDLNRNTSMHAAGVVIGYKPLVEIGPLCSEEDDEDDDGINDDIDNDKKQDLRKDYVDDWFNAKPENRIAVFGYDMKDCEKIGLVKFDFLGLQTLTVLTKACELIENNTGERIDINAIPVDDKKTFDFLAKGKLKGVFQLEAPLPRNALKRIKTNKILDIAAITSLNRPGPMENMPSFIRRKLGEEKCEYYHPILEPILKETYGIIIYQEQVMEVARKIAGYSLGEADILRRAMGKKIKEEMDKQSAVFCDRAEKIGLVSKNEAKKLFDIIEKFAGYGFNKAHAVSYTIISYQTAYLKAHYPVEFMIALMNLDINRTEKLNGFVNEAKSMGIEIIPPDINISKAEFSYKDGKIMYALGAIKGMGVGIANEICEIRDTKSKKGEKAFENLQDFLESCGKLMNKKIVESLAKSGSWKSLGLNIRTILENEDKIIDTISEFTKKSREDNSQNVINMFGVNDNIPRLPKLKQYEEYGDDKLSALEVEIFGFFMSVHPLDKYRDKIEKFKLEEGQDVLETVYNKQTRILMCGVITEIKMRFKNKKKFAFVSLLDLGGIYEASIFNDELINQKADILNEGTKVVLEAEATTNAETGTRLQIKDIYELSDFFSKYSKRSDIKLGMNKKNKHTDNCSDENAFVKKSDYKASNVRDEKQNNCLSSDNVNCIKSSSTTDNSKTNIINNVNFKQSKYSGIRTEVLYQDDFVRINIATISDIEKVKNDVKNGLYKGKKILLEINDSEVLIDG